MSDSDVFNLCVNENNIDVNKASEKIIEAYHHLIDKFMPERQQSRKQKHFFHKPWITKGLKVSIRTKNRLFKQTKHTNNPIVYENYKVFRNLLTRMKLKAKNIFYKDLAIRYGNNKSKIWKMVNEISKRKRSY